MQCMSKGNLAVYVYVLINLISPLSVLFARFVCTLLSLLDNLDMVGNYCGFAVNEKQFVYFAV